MERLAVCNRALYDQDILDKFNENNILKAELDSFKHPSVKCSSIEEWTNILSKAYQIIKDAIYDCVINNEIEYKYMGMLGLTPRQRIIIQYNIHKALVEITKSPSWSDRISNHIITGVEGSIQGLINSGAWVTLYSQINPTMMGNIIYENIEWQLENEILEDIPLFNCHRCLKADDCVTENNICIDCGEYEYKYELVLDELTNRFESIS